MEYRNLNDYEIIYMVRENDDVAQNMMFKKYLPVIKKIATKYFDFAKKCGVEFDDLVQEGMIALNKAINTYDENSGALFYTYVYLCIERHFVSYCRVISGYRHMPLNSSVGEEMLYRVVDNETLVIENDEDKFVELKNLLNFGDSAVFELRYNGFSFKEIGALLDMPISTVDGRMCKIRNIFRRKRKKLQ